MNNDELKALFDQQASNYDQQWAKLSPITNGLYFLLESVFADLPENARILCVGVGTGRELIYLAKKFPGWRFIAVDPSGAMLDACREAANKENIALRCTFHEGYVESLPDDTTHDGATCFLVSQFMVDKAARAAFFQQIANRLKPGGVLANADLAFDKESGGFDAILKVWMTVMSGSGVPAEAINKVKAAYEKDVAILPPDTVASIIQSGGFTRPVPFFQAGLIHAWFTKRE
ncbi:SAM-dependent methyltransferases [Halomonas citrativorans]|uniref:SAM-dependent methyltransferases n=1 Tax=Halomonas citrativorans TaxID=2742612 RepID=A0A1R4I5M8_9GAMM|nr:class I SAM-dependent methyltransferase [Halomonas citrativorans]SJN15112.1 SAM-dependent methyltransferases [Halomonas citrativorans]